VAKRIRTALAKADEIPCSSRGLFVLGLQQIIDSFIAGLLTDEAVEWLLMVEILKDNARPETGEVYGAMDMGWAKLVGQIAQAYGK
jgi:hypothetical protein